MANREESFDNLQESLANDCQTCPFGYYFHDLNPAGAGGFHWHDSEKSLLNEIMNDLFAWLPMQGDESDERICSDLTDLVKSVVVPNTNVDWDVLNSKLNDYLFQFGVRLAWIGTFYQLCSGDNEWASSLREEFHESYENEDSDEMSIDSNGVITSHITEDDVEDFVEFISYYGQS